MIYTPLHLAEAGGEKHYLPVTGDRYLLTGRTCPDQARHNNFEVRQGRSTGFFVITTWSEGTDLLLFPALHTYVFYQIS